MDTTAATPAAEPGAARYVFGEAGAGLGEAEIEAITRALSELVVPLGTAWTDLLGTEIGVEIVEISPGPTPRPADAEPDPTASILDGITDASAFSAVGAFGGELGTAVVLVPTPLGLVVVDLLLGGTGRPAGDRALSAIDLDLLSTVVAPTFGALRHLGNPDRIGDPVPVLTEIDDADLTARIAGGATVRIGLMIGEQSQHLLVVLSPAAARHLAGSAAATAAETPAEQSREILTHVLADVVVEAIVTFPAIQVPSRRILGLDVGDVIGLGVDPEQPLPLRVDGLHLADVRPARAGGDVACQIVSTTVGDPFRSPLNAPSHGGHS